MLVPINLVRQYSVCALTGMVATILTPLIEEIGISFFLLFCRDFTDYVSACYLTKKKGIVNNIFTLPESNYVIMFSILLARYRFGGSGKMQDAC